MKATLRRASPLVRASAVLPILVVVTLLIPSWAGATPASPNSSSPAAGTSARSTRAAAPAPSDRAASSAASVAQRGTGSGDSLRGREAFPPGPAVRTLAPDLVAPGYESPPAPMGLSDLGDGSSGAYVYNATSFEGAVTFASEPVVFNPGYAAFVEAPNWAALQLNTVAVNVSIPHEALGTFWIQNVVHDNGTYLELEDNVWNFTKTNAGMQEGTLLSPGGTLVPGEYYYRNGPAFRVSYPLTLDLYNNVSVVGGRPTVYLNYSISYASKTFVGSYDAIVFNALAGPNVPVFQVDGQQADAAGHLNDAELTFGGDGGGSGATFLSLNATVALRFASGLGAFQNIPSGYDFGADTGETSNGIAAYYLGSVEHLDAGPSLLYGLWNTSTSPIAPHASGGWIEIRLTVSPGYGFAFLSTESDLGLPVLTAAEFSYVPTNSTGVANPLLAPPAAGDPYELLAWADGYQNTSVADPSAVSGNATVDLALSPHAATMNAPVYLFSQAQAAALGASAATGAAYSAGLATLWLNASTVTLATPFLLLNDYRYPAFMLFAAEGLNFAVRLNAFEEAATASSYEVDLGVAWSVAQWTQGYFFFYGSGAFAVSNVSLPGNSDAYHDYDMSPPAAVEFFGTTDSSASHTAATQESFGVVVVNSTGASVSYASSTEGANAADSIYSGGLTSSQLSSNGSDPFGVQSWALYLVNSTGTTVAGLTATNTSVAVVAANASFAATTVDIVQAIAVLANNSSATTISGLTVNEGLSSEYTAYWTDSENVRVTGASVDGIGFDFLDDRSVTVVGLTVLGVESDGIDSFAGSSHGTFDWVNVTDQSLGVNASDANDVRIAHVYASDGSFGVAAVYGNNSSAAYVGANLDSIGVFWYGGLNVTLSGVNATDGSIAAWLVGVQDLSARSFEASGGSIALSWNYGANGTVSYFNATSGSLGVWVQNATNVSVADVFAQNASLGAPFFFAPLPFVELPLAAVALANDSGVNVSRVAAVNYGFGVLLNYTFNVTRIVNVTVWTSDSAITLNETNDTQIARVFAFGNFVGIDANNSSNLTFISSTVEGSATYGVQTLNGSFVNVVGDNFVGNRGSSVTGKFSSGRVQVVFTNTTDVNLASNYWADHTGTGAYPASKTHQDRTPLSGFNGSYLEFLEVGLPSSTRWTVGVSDGSLDVGYPSALSLFYIPSWVLANGTVTFLVVPPNGYVPDPASGSVLFDGTNANVTIRFNATHPTGTGGGLPIALYAGIGAAVAVVAVVAALLLMRSRRSREEPPSPEYEGPEWRP